MKDTKAKTVLHSFIEIVKKSKLKPNKLWVDQGRKFYNNLIQKWFYDNDILMYSAHKKGKPVVTEKFIKIRKGKICKKMKTNNSKSYFGYLNKLVDEYNNTYHCSIGKKPIHSYYFALT